MAKRGEREEGRQGEQHRGLTVQAIGLEGTALRQHGQHSLLSEEKLPNHPIATPETPTATGPWSQLKTVKDDWVPVGTCTQHVPPVSAHIPLPTLSSSPADRLSRISGSVMRVFVM